MNDIPIRIRDFPVVKEAKRIAEAQLNYCKVMMEEKDKLGTITVTKPDRNSPRMLTDTCDGIHPVIKPYIKKVVEYPTTVAGWLHKLDMEKNDAWLQGYERGFQRAMEGKEYPG